MPTTWTVTERIEQFGATEGFGLDAWDMTAWGSPGWNKAVRESTLWVKTEG